MIVSLGDKHVFKDFDYIAKHVQYNFDNDNFGTTSVQSLYHIFANSDIISLLEVCDIINHTLTNIDNHSFQV